MSILSRVGTSSRCTTEDVLDGQTVVELGHQTIQIILSWSLVVFHCCCLTSIVVVVRTHSLTVETAALGPATLSVSRVPRDYLGTSTTTTREVELLCCLRRSRDPPIVISFISS